MSDHITKTVTVQEDDGVYQVTLTETAREKLTEESTVRDVLANYNVDSGDIDLIVLDLKSAGIIKKS